MAQTAATILAALGKYVCPAIVSAPFVINPANGQAPALLTSVVDLAANAADAVAKLDPEGRAKLQGTLEREANFIDATLEGKPVPVPQFTLGFPPTPTQNLPELVRERFKQRASDLQQVAAYTASYASAPAPDFLSERQMEVIVSTTRLAYLVCGTDITDKNRIVYWQDDIASFLHNHAKLVLSVGRLEYRRVIFSPNNIATAVGEPMPFATAFVVKTPNVALTNAHVLKAIALRNAAGQWTLRQDKRVTLNFVGEHNYQCGSRSMTVNVKGILRVDEKLDAAALHIEPAPVPPLAIDTGAPVVVDQIVAVVGYPGEDPSIRREDQDLVFRAPDNTVPYYVKRFQPGKIKQLEQPAMIHHDASTVTGNSGSPIIRLSDGRVVGLHHSGVPYRFNSGTMMSQLQSLVGEAVQQTAASQAKN